jgi:hypothetical protein
MVGGETYRCQDPLEVMGQGCVVIRDHALFFLSILRILFFAGPDRYRTVKRMIKDETTIATT